MSNVGHNSGDTSTAYSVTADELRQFIERYEQLESEKKDVAEQQKELMAEAKGRGYDTKVLRKVVALRNGTMGWELAGFTCDRGKTASFPQGTPKGAAEAFARADAFAKRHGVVFGTRADLARWQAATERQERLRIGERGV